MVHRHRAVHVIVEFREPVHIFPHLFITGMENVRAVLVHVDAVHILGVDVAGDVIPPVNDQHPLARLVQRMSENHAVQTRTDNQIIVLHEHPPSNRWL